MVNPSKSTVTDDAASSEEVEEEEAARQRGDASRDRIEQEEASAEGGGSSGGGSGSRSPASRPGGGPTPGGGPPARPEPDSGGAAEDADPTGGADATTGRDGSTAAAAEAGRGSQSGGQPSKRARKKMAAAEFSERFGRDFNPSDVKVDGMSATLREGSLPDIERFRERAGAREVTRTALAPQTDPGMGALSSGAGFVPGSGAGSGRQRSLEEQVEAAAGADLDRGEDFTVTPVSEGVEGALGPDATFRTELTESGVEKARAAQREPTTVEIPELTLPITSAATSVTVGGDKFTIPASRDLGEQEDIEVGGTAVNRIPERVSAPVAPTQAALARVTGRTDVFDTSQVGVELPERTMGVPIAGAELEEAGRAQARGGAELAEDIATAEIPGGNGVTVGELPGVGAQLATAPILIQAGRAERQLTGDTERTQQAEGLGRDLSEATVRGGLGFAFSAPGTLATLTEESAEAGVGVASGDVTLEEVGGQGVAMGMEAGQQAVENPVQTAGALAGSAFLLGGAAAVGPRVGAATRFAVQPGEEIASIGLTRAAPGLARKFPNDRVDNEEVVLRGAARAGQAGADVGARVGAGVGGAARRAASVGSLSALRQSRLRVTRAPDAPALQIDPALKVELARTAGQRARRFEGRVGAASDVVQRAPTSPTEVADVGRRMVGRQRAAVEEARLGARASARSAVAEFDPRPDMDLRGRAVRGRDRLAATARERVAEARFHVSEAAARVADAPGRARQISSDMLSREVFRRRMDALEARVGLEVQARRTAKSLGEVPSHIRTKLDSTVSELKPDLSRPDIELPDVQGRAASKVQAVEDIGFRARERARQDVRGAVAEARFMAREASARVRNPPSVDVPTLDLEGRAIRTADRTQARVREAKAEARFALSQAVDVDVERPDLTSPRDIASLTELTVRLEPREPTVISTGSFDDVPGVETGEGEFPTDSPAGGAFGGPRSEGDLGAESEIDVGDGPQVSTMRTRGRPTDRTGVGEEFDLRGSQGMEIDGREAGPVEMAGRTTVDIQEDGPRRVDDTAGLDVGGRQVPRLSGETQLATEPDVDMELGREPAAAVDQEFEQETDVRLEQEFEQELETEFELESETGREVETLARLDSDPDRRRRRGAFDADERTFAADVTSGATVAFGELSDVGSGDPEDDLL